ncbi:DUF2510 domain-containing protein [Glaciihabitans arcticus]|uniref:DUF2510 domain-containing protein n=1 Tax=Glaciihabitans arcticus TaxID=2668039 RepID=A0A4Q9GVA0_9MICO|nr:DUF2510 domain-containing protein [Glaciihabitans arcticus]TBN57127.1 DUF2510 domain-containing protein [Glaciihabitans arcticus]
MSTVIAGWYPDPAGSGRSRWWDGTQWTESYETPYTLAPQTLAAPVGTPAYNNWIWAIVGLLAVRTLLSGVPLVIPGYFESSASGATTGEFAMVDLVTGVISWILYGVTVALAYFDWRTLRDSGVPKPFHWAFAFLPTPVYLIGRAVVTRRRTGKGFATLWIAIVYMALSFIAFIGIVVAASIYAVDNLPGV